MREDSALHARLQGREPPALDQWIAELSGPVLQLASVVLGRCGGPEDAEEIAADVFATAWQRIGEYDPGRGSLRSWVLMLTKYAALDRRRRHLRQGYTPTGDVRLIPLGATPEPPAAETPEEQVLRRDRRERLRQALDRLPAAQRELLIRRYLFEEPISDLARDAGQKRSTIDNRLWRARQALRALLEEKGEVSDYGHEAL